MSTVSRSPSNDVLALRNHDIAEQGHRIGPHVENAALAGRGLVLLLDDDAALGLDPADLLARNARRRAGGRVRWFRLRDRRRKTPRASCCAAWCRPARGERRRRMSRSCPCRAPRGMAALILIGLSRFCEKPCSALGGPPPSCGCVRRDRWPRMQRQARTAKCAATMAPYADAPVMAQALAAIPTRPARYRRRLGGVSTLRVISTPPPNTMRSPLSRISRRLAFSQPLRSFTSTGLSETMCPLPHIDRGFRQPPLITAA